MEPAWEALPAALLGKCINCTCSDARLSAFGTCKAFAKAIVANVQRPRLIIHLTDSHDRLETALRLLSAWDVDIGLEFTACVNSNQCEPVRLKPLITQLIRSGVRVPRVSRLACCSLEMDACAPEGLDAVLPHLRELALSGCRVPDGMLPLSGCTQLTHLELVNDIWHMRAPEIRLVSSPEAWKVQLEQLAGLPTLISLTLHADLFPASFLPLWADQLTSLTLHHTFATWLENTNKETWETQWQDALRFAAHCCNLQKLHVGPCTMSEAKPLLSSLPKLQELYLTDGWHDRAADASGLTDFLFQLPHLTRLSCASLCSLMCHAPDRSWDSNAASICHQPACLRELRLKATSPYVLARLPLKTLTNSLRMQRLHFYGPDDKPVSLADVLAAVRNLSCCASPRPLSWWYGSQDGPANVANVAANGGGAVTCPTRLKIKLDFAGIGVVYAGAGDAAAILRAAALLIPQNIQELVVKNTLVDAAFVSALHAVAPAQIDTITFRVCQLAPSCWVQLARCFPSVSVITITNPITSPPAAGIMACFIAGGGTSAHPLPPLGQCTAGPSRGGDGGGVDGSGQHVAMLVDEQSASLWWCGCGRSLMQQRRVEIEYDREVFFEVHDDTTWTEYEQSLEAVEVQLHYLGIDACVMLQQL